MQYTVLCGVWNDNLSSRRQVPFQINNLVGIYPVIIWEPNCEMNDQTALLERTAVMWHALVDNASRVSGPNHLTYMTQQCHQESRDETQHSKNIRFFKRKTDSKESTDYRLIIQHPTLVLILIYRLHEQTIQQPGITSSSTTMTCNIETRNRTWTNSLEVTEMSGSHSTSAVKHSALIR